nr:dynamin 1 [Hymenolepis microstoma]
MLLICVSTFTFQGEDDLNQENNPILKRQVETIRNLVQSYMKIVTKTQLDLVPKITMHLLIDDAKKYMKSDLLPALYALDANRLMEESPEEKRRKQDLVTMYNTMKEALNIIADVTTHTITTPVPPPITDDWLEVESNSASQKSVTGPSRPSIGPSRGNNNSPVPQPRVAPPIPASSRPSNVGPSPLVSARTAPLIPQLAPALHASNSTGDLFDSGGGFPNYSSSSINNHRAASTIAPPLMSPFSNSLTSNSSSTWNSNNVGLKVFDQMAKSLGNTTSMVTNNGPVAGGARALASHFESLTSPQIGPPIPPRPN